MLLTCYYAALSAAITAFDGSGTRFEWSRRLSGPRRCNAMFAARSAIAIGTRLLRRARGAYLQHRVFSLLHPHPRLPASHLPNSNSRLPPSHPLTRQTMEELNPDRAAALRRRSGAPPCPAHDGLSELQVQAAATKEWQARTSWPGRRRARYTFRAHGGHLWSGIGVHTRYVRIHHTPSRCK